MKFRVCLYKISFLQGLHGSLRIWGLGFRVGLYRVSSLEGLYGGFPKLGLA